MKLSEIKTLDELRKFVEKNKKLYDAKGNSYLSKDLLFRVKLDLKEFSANYHDEVRLDELFDKSSYSRYSKQMDKAIKKLSEAFK